MEIVVLAPVFALSGSASATGSLALTRMVGRRERLEAGANASAMPRPRWTGWDERREDHRRERDGLRRFRVSPMPVFDRKQ